MVGNREAVETMEAAGAAAPEALREVARVATLAVVPGQEA